MPSLFGGGGGSRQHFQSTQQRTLGGRNRLSGDILGNMLLGQLMKPPTLSIPSPLGKSISGLESILPSLMGSAFGPNRGLASQLSGRPMSAGIAGPTGETGGAFPSFGATPSRADLGIQDPNLDPAGFAPPIDTTRANLPSVRIPKERQKERKLERNLARREERGKDSTRAQRRLDKYRGKKKFIEPLGPSGAAA